MLACFNEDRPFCNIGSVVGNPFDIFGNKHIIRSTRYHHGLPLNSGADFENCAGKECIHFIVAVAHFIGERDIVRYKGGEGIVKHASCAFQHFPQVHRRPRAFA